MGDIKRMVSKKIKPLLDSRKKTRAGIRVP